jgi:nucleolar protein TMA23
MNAHALLSAQGWRGHGHSLHKHDDSIGLAKPLLLSRKDNTKGLGNAQHFNADQWWMNAFDEQLKGLETNKKGHVVQTLKTGKLNTIENGSLGKYSVYTSFVRGGFLEGTLSLLKSDTTTSESDNDSDGNETSKSTKTKTEAKSKESKEERKARKAAKKQRKAEKTQEKAARRERKKLKKLKTNGLTGSETSDIAKDEKRRRRARKEEKRRKRETEGKRGKS